MKTAGKVHKYEGRRATSSTITQNGSGKRGTFEFTDNRAGTAAQRKQVDMLHTAAYANTLFGNTNLTENAIQMISDYAPTRDEQVRQAFERYLGRNLRSSTDVKRWSRQIFESVSFRITTDLAAKITWDTHRSGISGKLQSIEDLATPSDDLDTNVNKIVKLIGLNKKFCETYWEGMEGNVLAETKHTGEIGRSPFDFKPWELAYDKWPKALLIRVAKKLKPKINAYRSGRERKPRAGAWSRVTRYLRSDTDPDIIQAYLEYTWPKVSDMQDILTSVGYAWSEEIDTEPLVQEHISIGALSPHGSEYRQHYAGERINILNEKNRWIKEARAWEMPLLSGPSGTSLRYLNFWYEHCRRGPVNAKQARLVVLANLLPPSSHHSYHEIMTACMGIGGLTYHRFSYDDMLDIEPAKAITRRYVRIKKRTNRNIENILLAGE